MMCGKYIVTGAWVCGYVEIYYSLSRSNVIDSDYQEHFGLIKAIILNL